MKFSNIVTRKTFTVGGVEKVRWLNVGTLKEMDDGKRFIELNLFPNETLFVFEKTEKTEPLPLVDNSQEINPENIPF